MRIQEIERENTRSLSAESLFWKRLWACKTRGLNNDDDDDDISVRIYTPVLLLIVVVTVCHIISSSGRSLASPLDVTSFVSRVCRVLYR